MTIIQRAVAVEKLKSAWSHLAHTDYDGTDAAREILMDLYRRIGNQMAVRHDTFNYIFENPTLYGLTKTR